MLDLKGAGMYILLHLPQARLIIPSGFSLSLRATGCRFIFTYSHETDRFYDNDISVDIKTVELFL